MLVVQNVNVARDILKHKRGEFNERSTLYRFNEKLVV